MQHEFDVNKRLKGLGIQTIGNLGRCEDTEINCKQSACNVWGGGDIRSFVS